jgi:hypothetical protein
MAGTSFKSFIQSKALEDKLPFGIDFEITPPTGLPTTNVAGFKIPRADELLSREAWFFELLESGTSNRRLELQSELNLLARDLKEKMSMKTNAEALEAITNPSEEIAQDDRYIDFSIENANRFSNLAELAKLLDGDRATQWLRVSFFLLSRYSSEWTMGQSAALRPSQINELNAFITREANGGVGPESEEEQEEDSESEDLGKKQLDSENKKAIEPETGNKSSGKPKE